MCSVTIKIIHLRVVSHFFQCPNPISIPLPPLDCVHIILVGSQMWFVVTKPAAVPPIAQKQHHQSQYQQYIINSSQSLSRSDTFVFISAAVLEITWTVPQTTLCGCASAIGRQHLHHLNEPKSDVRQTRVHIKSASVKLPLECLYNMQYSTAPKAYKKKN